MPFYTNEEVEKRKANGEKMYKLNCGWNLSPHMIVKISDFLNNWTPKTETEKRDKHILKLAFIEDMNASQIARLNDPLIVGVGNRSRGKPLSPSSILAICYKYFPETKQRKYKGKNDKARQQRIELYKLKQDGEINKPKVCATCGDTENVELHHIVPIALGGNNDYFNLIYMCHDCHMKLHHIIYDKLEIPKKDSI